MFNWVQLMQILLCLYFLQILDFLSSLKDSYIPRRWNNASFSGKLSTGNGFVINFDLVKCTAKINVNSYPIYNGNLEGGLSPERQNKA